jgi:hypothetical protein
MSMQFRAPAAHAALARAAVWPWLLVSAFLAAGLGNGCADASSGAPGMGPADGPDASPDSASGGGQAEVSTPFADATACQPGDTRTYRPDAYHSAAPAGQGACPTPELIDWFYAACLGPTATTQACQAYKLDVSGGPCAKCIQTAEGEPHYGPLIDHQGSFISANISGCIELTDPGELSCARALQALSGCEIAACRANCPVQDSASRAAYDGCASVADESGCGTYADAMACHGIELDAGPAQRCIASSFKDFYDAVVPLFCGLPPARPDAGPLVIDAATTDALPDAPRTADASVTDAADVADPAHPDGSLSDAATRAASDGPFLTTDAGGEASSDAREDAPRD